MNLERQVNGQSKAYARHYAYNTPQHKKITCVLELEKDDKIHVNMAGGLWTDKKDTFFEGTLIKALE